MPLRRKRKSKINAPCIVYFAQALNEDGKKQLAVYGECTYGGARVGPVWGHAWPSVSRCLATLSKRCGCGRKYHKHRYSEGRRILRTKVD